MKKNRRKIKWKYLLPLLFFAVCYLVTPVAEANVPGVRLVKIQEEEYYDTLREAFYMEDYYVTGACNGWVQSVLNNSGLVPEIVVDGTTVMELNDALSKMDCFELVASREGGQSDYQEASDQMIEDVNAGKIKAGDVVIYTKNMSDYENTGGYHWLHAAIVMKDLYQGSVDNYKNYRQTRWKEQYWGFPTIAHSLDVPFGVEYYTPMTAVHSRGTEDDGSTGYYVYRINLEKAEAAKKKAEEDKTATETEEAASTEEVASTEKTTSPAPAKITTEEITESGSANAEVENTSSDGGVAAGAFWRVLGVLAVLVAGILLFLIIIML